jgi:hypothetical protein
MFHHNEHIETLIFLKPTIQRNLGSYNSKPMLCSSKLPFIGIIYIARSLQWLSKSNTNFLDNKCPLKISILCVARNWHLKKKIMNCATFYRYDYSIQIFMQQFINSRNWEAVLNRNSVEGPIGNTKSPRTILFFFTRRTGDENGLVLGRIIPLTNMVSTCFSISCFWK